MGDKLNSPCTGVCTVHHEARICIGCLRSVEEIARWKMYGDQERAEILAQLPGRAGLVPQRRRRRRRPAGPTGQGQD
ncbi:DUF1289 domain-containing protein [Mangrovicoccus algicola]|uniref:DUF1289 domain-containing protein n=1 Tax=Mangrovicoccus algicola TaxID=2771008 RepID=A0A8J6Z753_9RHOB|nr:DUF1289 domain-containing protein [Mangrovicoccus algicola]MBE3637700.1 DUF1289 domain-containing protein [Mangrovicoccus algicola]